MIHVEHSCKSLPRLSAGLGLRRRGRLVRLPAGRDLRPARAQRRGQDDDPADPEHGAQADRRPRDRRRLRRGRPSPQAVRSSIGYMSASTGIYDRMTAWELVEYFGRLYGLPRDRLARADGDDLRLAQDERLPRRAGLEDVDRDEAEGLDRPDDRPRPAGPDLRRADLGPRRAGGPRRCCRRSLELRDLGKTIVFSTHSMHEVEKLCSRVAIIHKGRLQAEGTPEELLERFDQPDLEELFFFLVERADAAAAARCRPTPRPAPGVDARRSDRPSLLDRETRPTSCAGRTCS